MPWELEIHIIDVDQGDSSLIIAKDPGPSPEQRTMLIDGGKPRYARVVHDYIAAQNIGSVDHILVTNYDEDHAGGILSLLTADNLYAVCDAIAKVAAPAARSGKNRAERIAKGAAAAYAAVKGAYDDSKPGGGGKDSSGAAGRVADKAKPNAGSDDMAAAEAGIQAAKDYLLDPADLNPSFLFSTTTQNKIARMAGKDAAQAIDQAIDVRGKVRRSVFDLLKDSLRTNIGNCDTGGIYRQTHVIDIGAANILQGYVAAVDGKFTQTGGNSIQAPGIYRLRSSVPDLGEEVLWNNSLPNAGPNKRLQTPPANAPAAFVVACLKYVLGSANPFAYGADTNSDSIGLIVRFNNFFYYTGGDLPSQGEELVAARVVNNYNQQRPPGDPFAAATRIACFKCGHHGAATSTSQNFLNTAQPSGAFISCGENAFPTPDDHPTQVVIDLLHNDHNVKHFYLTNCRYPRNHVPASVGRNQLTEPGNKSRVAGKDDSNLDNLAVARLGKRGDIKVTISEAVSQRAANVPSREYEVRYYDNDGQVENFKNERTTF